MDHDDIRVSWRAAIMPGNSGQVIYGRLNRLGKGRVVVGTDYNLPLGHRCNLAMQLPRNRPDAANQIVEGCGVVALSVLSSMQFHITIDRLELDGDGEALLEAHFRMHGKSWKSPR